jgi:4-hydroxy-tetrahydrodipicolinate synthase
MRAAILQQMFPSGAPSLWCPLLTHYDAKGGISESRMAAHLQFLSPFAKGFLIPGSTGDGWELRDREIDRVVQIALDQAQRLEFVLLIGVLKKDTEAARRSMEQLLQGIQQRTKEPDPLAALLKARVAGFTVCPPTGRELQQEEILDRLGSVPVATNYQERDECGYCKGVGK